MIGSKSNSEIDSVCLIKVLLIYMNQLTAIHFSIDGKKDAIGDAASNTKLLLLGTLCYIGRSWTLDDLEEANGISREVNRIFLHTYLKYGSTVLYKKWVLDPVRKMNVSLHEKLFKMAGFNGCIGSTDATHVGMLNCAA